MEILTVGSVAFDSIKTPFDERRRILGGSATYFSLAASYFAPVNLVSVVGGDFTKEHEAVFAGKPIDISGLERRGEGKTFHWAGEYHYDMNQRTTHATELNVFADFKPRIPEGYRGKEIVFLANIDPELQMDVLAQVQKPFLTGLDTMNFWIESKKPALEAVIRKVDFLVINESEVRELSGKSNLLRAASELMKMGPRHLIVKQGEYGVLAFWKEGFFSAPAYPLEDVVDPTGAGDTFAGGFFGYVARSGGLDETILRQALVLGSAMASFCVEAFGPDALKNLDRADILDRYRAFRRMTEFGDLQAIH